MHATIERVDQIQLIFQKIDREIEKERERISKSDKMENIRIANP